MNSRFSDIAEAKYLKAFNGITALLNQTLAAQNLIAENLITENLITKTLTAMLDDAAWKQCRVQQIACYWSGAIAPATQQTQVRAGWTDEALLVRFQYHQSEPLIINSTPQTKMKTIGLWERDVCEVFVAPDSENPHRYYEFEVAPTGEWLDLQIEAGAHGRTTNWEYVSNLQAIARVAVAAATTTTTTTTNATTKDAASKGATGKEVTIMLCVPWTAFNSSSSSPPPLLLLPPRAGESWRVNFFRCMGAETTEAARRSYLAWQPTQTAQPSFHVPQAFGELRFVK